MSNFYTVKKTIKGKEYTAQFNGLGFSADVIDESYIEGTSNTSIVKLSKKLLDNVIVEPKMKIEDFGKDIIGKTEKKEINGKEYTAKFNGLMTALNIVDNSYIEGTSNTSIKKLNNYILENVIVSPENLTMDDFETTEELGEVIAFGREAMQGWNTMEEFNEVIRFAREVMQGNFREKAEKPKTTNKSSKA